MKYYEQQKNPNGRTMIKKGTKTKRKTNTLELIIMPIVLVESLDFRFLGPSHPRNNHRTSVLYLDDEV